jgi:hypothetical protein
MSEQVWTIYKFGSQVGGRYIIGPDTPDDGVKVVPAAEVAQLREQVESWEDAWQKSSATADRLREAIRRHLESKTFAGKLSHDCHNLRAALGDTPDE